MFLEGQSVVVTGATRGIGKVTATHLAGIGAQVAVVGRNEERAERVVGDILSSGGQASFFRCDLTIESEVAALFEAVVQRFGAVHAVVNNAAATDIATRDRPVVDQPTEDFDYFVRANVHSAFWSFKYGIPAMGGKGGAFVTVSSIEAVTPRPGEPSYATTKTAVCGLARAVAVDYGHHGIRSNVLMLGFIETNATRPFVQDPRIGAVIREATGGAPPTSLDAARAVAFLVSDAANGFNGATLTLDRGMTILGRVPELTLDR